MKLAQSRVFRTRAVASGENRASGGTSKLAPQPLPFFYLHVTIVLAPMAATSQLTFDHSCVSHTDLTISSSQLDHPPHPSPPPNPSSTANRLHPVPFSPPNLSLPGAPQKNAAHLPHSLPNLIFQPRAGMFQRPSYTPAPPVQTSVFPSSLTAWSHSKNAGKSVPRWCCESLKQVRKG